MEAANLPPSRIEDSLFGARRRLSYFCRLSWLDWLFAALLACGAGYAGLRYGANMDGYERGILAVAAPVLIWLGWAWKPMRSLMLAVAALSLFAVWQYSGADGPDLARADRVFVLKYFLASQLAILWMSGLIFLSALFFWTGLAARWTAGGAIGSRLCWAAVTLGLTGMLVRWYESYLLGAEIGHIPISNLYEVFILFTLMTSLLYLHYEQRYATRALGPFVMLVVSAAVGFLLWYMASRGAHEILPLVPALQSWWMKIHVPANFVGYGAFALAAMVGVAYLLKAHDVLADRLPPLEVLDDVMYKAITVGFAFFTIATMLGALWAADAWGGYWSWDPKETWALIVWLNYAAWLHMRMIKGLRGRLAAWWALIGLLVTIFAFLGVNLFLSGLHSYGEL